MSGPSVLPLRWLEMKPERLEGDRGLRQRVGSTAVS